MQALRLGAGSFRRIFERGLRSVNPDVWREVGSLTLLAYSLFLPKREDVLDRPGASGTPIVLVHGLGGNRGTWWPLRAYLMAHGQRRIFAMGYEEGSIEEHAGTLRGFIERVKIVTGEERVDIVAHSLGGVIARYAIQRLGTADSVRTLITLATPHQGTYAAHYANTPLTVPLRPDSPLIRDLNAEDPTGFGVRIVCVCSDRDVYVVPADNMRCPGAECVRVPGTSHTRHLTSPEVFHIVLRSLGGETVASTACAAAPVRA